MTRLILMVVFALLTGGMTIYSVGPGPFPVVGKFLDYNEPLNGQLRVDFGARPDQTAYLFFLETTNSKLYCEGVGRVTKNPVFVGSCRGNKGVAEFRCTHGKRLIADLSWTDCGRGQGVGSEAAGGALFTFTFGLPQAEAQKYLASAVKEGEGKPPYPNDQAQAPRGGGGTGFLISDDGLIVTNHHVIDKAGSIEVYQGNVMYRATVVAQDAANDLALLKTEIKGRPLSIASARTSMRGEEVLTLGYPLSNIAGESQKATFGRINATVGLNDDVRYLQIDVPIQPGNSGGPLLNKRGEVIGVASASLDEQSAFAKSGAIPQNVNYAVKADYIMVLLPPSAQLPAARPQQEMELPALVTMFENSVFRIVSKP